MHKSMTLTKKLFMLLGAVILLLFSATAALAAEPNYGTGIVVDGDPSEWDLTNDFFANMYEAGDPGKQHLSTAYLRYNCTSNTLYVLVKVEDGVTADLSPTDAWVKVYDLSQNPQVDGNSASFEWLPNNQGYEASFSLAEADYTEIEIHLRVTWDGQSGRTSSTGKKAQGYTPLTIDCPELGSLTIVKEANPKDGTDFDFTLTGELPLQPFINEFHYDNQSTDQNEGVEIAGAAGTDLINWSVVLYNGANGKVYDTISLFGSIDDEGGGVGALFFPQSDIQNGSPDGMALVDPSDNVIQFISYEGGFSATEGPANGQTSIDIGVSEPTDGSNNDSLQLTGTGSTAGDFTWTGPTAHSQGSLNSGQTLTLPTFNASFTLDDESAQPNGSIEQSKSFADLTPSDYTIEEVNLPGGWTLDNIDCNGDNPQKNGDSVTVTVGAGDNITCTFTNKQQLPASITVKKAVKPKNISKKFTFKGDLGTFKLKTNPGPNDDLKDTITFDELEPGIYTIGEKAEKNWELTEIVCTPDETDVEISGNTMGISVDYGDDVTCVFHNRRLGWLTVKKYNDMNQDGKRQNNSNYKEPFLPGWEFVLYNKAGKEVGSKTTSNNGKAIFRNLKPGKTYTVCETEQDDWVNTDPGQNSVTDPKGLDRSCKSITINSGGGGKTVKFGNVKRGAIHVQKYHDLNQNGKKGPHEPGLNGWRIVLKTADGQLVARATTHSLSPHNKGWVWFEDLKPGRYKVCERPQEGWASTDRDNNPLCEWVNLRPGGEKTVKLGNIKLVDILVHKYHDKNGDGDKDFGWPPPEPGLNGWEMKLYLFEVGQAPVLVNTQNTGNLGPILPPPFDGPLPGWAKFENVKPPAPGQWYIVCETMEPGWANSDPGNGHYCKPVKWIPLQAVPPFVPPPLLVHLKDYLPIGVAAFGNYEQPKIIVTKDGNPDAPWIKDFPFAFTSDLPGAPFYMNPDTSREFYVDLGKSYGIREAGTGRLSNWDLTSLTCDGGDPQYDGNKVTVKATQPGQVIECTFVNERRPQVKIFKYEDKNADGTQNGDDGPLAGWRMYLYMSDGQGGWNHIQVNANHSTNAQGITNYTNLQPGVPHLLCEDKIEGWANSDPANSFEYDGRICQELSNPQYGQVHNIVFGNYRLGRILVRKESSPTAPWLDWDFSGLGGFTLDTDPDSDTPQEIFKDTLAPGAYTIVETSPKLKDNWVVNVECTGEGNSTFSPVENGVTVNLVSGDDVTCVFHNQRRGQIKIIKYEDKDLSGTEDGDDARVEGWQMFLYMSDGQGGWTQIQPREVRTNANGIANYTNLEPFKEYLVCEEASGDWGNSQPGNNAILHDGKICQAVTIADYGQDQTVAFGNYRYGQIRLVKDTVSVNAPWLDFQFSSSNHGNFSLNGGDDPNTNTKTFDNLVQGTTYSFTENGPGNWTLTDLYCDADLVEIDKDNATVSVKFTQSGQQATCTFENQRQPQIKILKYNDVNGNVQNDGEPAIAGWQMFLYIDDGNGGWQQIQPREVRTDDKGVANYTNLKPGKTHLVCEEARAGWTNTDPADSFIHDGKICQPVENLAYGEVRNVTFGNHQLKGDLQVIKVVTPADDFLGPFLGYMSIPKWVFTLDNDATRTIDSLGGNDAFNQIDAGQHTLVETSADPQFDLGKHFTTMVNCGNETPVPGTSVDVDIPAGGSTGCIFTNILKVGSVKLVKIVKGEAPDSDWQFSVTGPFGINNGGTLNAEGEEVPPGENNFLPAPVGKYTIAEIQKDGYTGSAVCTNAQGQEIGQGTTSVEFELAENDQVTCTFTNSQQPGSIKITKLVEGQVENLPVFDFTFNNEANFKLGHGDWRDFDSLPAGDYSIVEDKGSKWTLLASCMIAGTDQPANFSGLGDSGVTVHLPAGQNVECAFTNSRPNAATLERVEATAGEGQVEVRWTTATEQGTVGYNVMRSNSADGPFEAVNDRLILAAGNSFEGAEYSFVDSSVSAGITYYYYIQEVETDGGTLEHTEAGQVVTATP